MAEEGVAIEILILSPHFSLLIRWKKQALLALTDFLLPLEAPKAQKYLVAEAHSEGGL